VVAGGGVYDWLSHYGVAELRFPWRDYLGASPLLDAREADARSPVRHAPAIRTGLGDGPGAGEVLLVHGVNDGRAHVYQARVMYRALREAGVKASLLIYQREAHLLIEPDHVRDLLQRATAPVG
jgi:dipeptidyl aminopeptidase/acylaminoacyl peptidase